MTENPFQKLIRSKTELDLEAQQQLADILEPYIWIDPDQDTVEFKQTAPKMTAREKTFILLLGQKVKTLINSDLNETLSSGDVERHTGLAGGTVRPALKDLFETKMIDRNENGYQVAEYISIKEIKSVFKSKE